MREIASKNHISHAVSSLMRRGMRAREHRMLCLGQSSLIMGLALLVATALVFVSLPVPPLAAQSGDLDNVTPDDVNRIARQLYCPVCPNTPLDVCETQACQDWREMIRQKLTEGASDQEIIDYFAEQYGPRVLAQPPPSGFNILVWLVPGAVLIAGVFALVTVLRSWSRRSGSSTGKEPEPPSELPADYVERVEREMRMRSE